MLTTTSPVSLICFAITAGVLLSALIVSAAASAETALAQNQNQTQQQQQPQQAKPKVQQKCVGNIHVIVVAAGITNQTGPVFASVDINDMHKNKTLSPVEVVNPVTNKSQTAPFLIFNLNMKTKGAECPNAGDVAILTVNDQVLVKEVQTRENKAVKQILPIIIKTTL